MRAKLLSHDCVSCVVEVDVIPSLIWPDELLVVLAVQEVVHWYEH